MMIIATFFENVSCSTLNRSCRRDNGRRYMAWGFTLPTKNFLSPCLGTNAAKSFAHLQVG